jgi:hypothetical protein
MPKRIIAKVRAAAKRTLARREPDITPEIRAELDRRYAEHDPGELLTAAEVGARLGRLGRKDIPTLAREFLVAYREREAVRKLEHSKGFLIKERAAKRKLRDAAGALGRALGI